MNKQKWLIAGLTLALAASLSVGIAACGVVDAEPDTPAGHTHVYDTWDHNDTQHWKYCDEHGTDKTNIDETTRSAHDFSSGDCVCGMKKPSSGTTGGEEKPDEKPTAELDTREFWVVGSGAGDLKNCSFTELKSNFKLTKQSKTDENGYTVYTSPELTLYAGDTLKVVQDLDWDDGLGYFGVGDIKNNDGSLVDGGGPGNITPAAGKDGKYIFTVRTKPDIAFTECTLEFELVEPVEPLKNTEEIYLVGSLYRYTTQWPKNGSVSGCLKLNYDEASGEWSITLRLGGKKENNQSVKDEFKLYNSVNGKYFPDGTGNNWEVSGSTDGENKKASGDYKISWKTGDLDVTFTLLSHEHVYDRDMNDTTQHFKRCWLDDEVDASSRENHIYDDEQDATCNKCGYERHIHTYDQWGRNETQHWKQCPIEGAISPEGKQDHVYDQPGDKCICGQEKGAEACKHEGKINFTYTAENVPTPQEAGGTLHGTCATCSEEVDIPYDKIADVNIFGPSSMNKYTMLEDDHKYYLTLNENKNQATSGIYLGYEIKAAGTFILRADLVYGADCNDGTDLELKVLAVWDACPPVTKTFSSGDGLLVKFSATGAGKLSTTASEVWLSKMTFDAPMSTTEKAAFRSMTVTFTQEDVGNYIYMSIGCAKYVTGKSTAGMKFYVRTDFAPAAASISAPAEVALLPGKND